MRSGCVRIVGSFPAICALSCSPGAPFPCTRSTTRTRFGSSRAALSAPRPRRPVRSGCTTYWDTHGRKNLARAEIASAKSA